jgi:hypothetical protein
MNRIEQERTPLYMTDAKICARHIVRESLDEILSGNYEVPSPHEMIHILRKGFEHPFDEFMTRRKIKKSHLDWSEDQIDAEIELQKRRFENELSVNLQVAAINAIGEIENLILSLNEIVKRWKIENL